MAKTIQCPKCNQPISVNQNSISDDGRLSCSSCGSSFKVQRKPAPAALNTSGVAQAAGVKNASPMKAPSHPQASPLADNSAELPDTNLLGGLPAFDDFPQQGSSSPFPSQAIGPFDFGATSAGDDLLSSMPAFDDESQVPTGHSNLWAIPANSLPSQAAQPTAAQPVASKSTSRVDTVKSVSGRPAMWLIGGGIAVGSLIVLALIVGLFSMFGGKPPANNVVADSGTDDRSAANIVDEAANEENQHSDQNLPPQGEALQPRFGSVKRTGRAIVFTKPIPGIESDPISQNVIDFREQRQKFLETKVHDPLDEPPPEFVAEQELTVEPEHWKIAPDPAPPTLAYEVSPNISLKIEEKWTNWTGAVVPAPGKKPVDVDANRNDYTGNWDTQPVLACKNGPFVFITPQLNHSPVGWKLTPRNDKWIKLERREDPIDDIAVIDLRTGKEAGKFSWKIPFWRDPILSPDGMTLVGPHNSLPLPSELQGIVPIAEKEKKELKDQQGSLFVWKRDSDAKPLQLRVSGKVTSMTFANDRVLVVLVEEPKPVLEAWDTITGKQVRVISLDSGLNYDEDQTQGEPHDQATAKRYGTKIMTTSGGGKYAAVFRNDGLKLISLVEGKVIGTLPLKGPETIVERYASNRDVTERPAKPGEGDFSGNLSACVNLEFTRDGEKLVAAYSESSFLRVVEFDVASGKSLRNKTWQAYGASTKRGAISLDGRGYFTFDSVTYPFDFDEVGIEDVRFPLIEIFQPSGPYLGYRSQGDAKFLCSIDRNEVDSILENSLALDFSKLPKRAAASPANRGAIKKLIPSPPAEIVPLPELPTQQRLSTANTIKDWPAAFGDRHALVVTRRSLGTGYHAIDGAILDLSQAGVAVSSQPFELLSYEFTEGTVYDRPVVGELMFPTAMTANGAMFAFGDPAFKGRAEVWTANPPSRKHLFISQQPDGDYFSWMGFDAQNNLLTLENGVLTSWDVSGQSVIGRYSIKGEYYRPVVFTPDRKLMLVSRGTTFDLLEAETGKCLNRYSFDNSSLIASLILSPDGKQVALNFGEQDASTIQADVPRSKEIAGKKYAVTTSAVINLASGEARVCKDRTEIKAWCSNEHLLTWDERRAWRVFDLNLNLETIEFTNLSPFAVSDDGRGWSRYEQLGWRALSITGDYIEAEKPFFDKDRYLFDMIEHPVQVVLDIGNPTLAQQAEKPLLTSMQKDGWKIGPSQYQIKATPEVRDSDYTIRFLNGNEISVPTVFYWWQLLDDNGREVARGPSGTTFNPKTTKYRTQVDLETRRQTGDDAFNFGAKDPATAIAEELLDSGVGLERCGISGINSPELRLKSGGTYFVLPHKLIPSPMQD